MRRRDFIATLASTVAAWPIAANAQSTNKVFRLAALSPANAQLDSIRTIVLPELAKANLVEGRNLILDARSGSMETLPELARELVAARPDVVMAVSGAAIGAVKASSGIVPIVMSFSDYDPVAAGFAASYAKPGGNITGIAMFATVLDAKRLQLLHEAIPTARRVAVLAVSEARHQSTLATIGVTAAVEGIQLIPVYAEGPASYPQGFAAMRAAEAQALLIVAAPEFNRDAEILADLATENGLATMCEWRQMVARGCVLGYGPDASELWRRAADYVIRVLNGASPSELPIEGPARFEFGVNLKTAKKLSLKLPTSILLRADEVIE